MFKFLIPLLLMLSPSLVYADHTKHTFVLSGAVMEQNHTDLYKRFSLWLSHQAHYPLDIKRVNSYNDLSNFLHRHPDALTWIGGVSLLQGYKRHEMQLLAVPIFKGAPVYHSLIITQEGRKEKALTDFKHQVLAYPDVYSSSGFIAPTYALKAQGLDIQNYFRYLMRTETHENSIEAVLAHQADVAAVDEYIFTQYLSLHPHAANQLTVLQKLGPYPFPPLIAGREVSKQTMQQLQEALIHMPNDAEGAKILKAFGLDGFIRKDISYYKPIQAILEALQ